MNNVLIEVGVLDNMRYIIMESISIAKTCVKWNGKKGDYFETKKCITYLSTYLCYVWANSLIRLWSK